MHDVSGVPCRNYRAKPPTPEGDVRLIPLSDGFYAYVDATDYEWLSAWLWYSQNGYAGRRQMGKILLMHRLIMQPPDDMLIDHIDGNRMNNCRCNLRICTRAENQRNKRRHARSISIFKGVSYNKQAGKWFSQCWFEGRYHVGPYVDDEAEAARDYDRMAVDYFGEFARLNFPEEWPAERREQVYAQRLGAGTMEDIAERKQERTRPPGAQESSHEESQ